MKTALVKVSRSGLTNLSLEIGGTINDDIGSFSGTLPAVANIHCNTRIADLYLIFEAVYCGIL